MVVMTVRMGLNGFGRTGRSLLRAVVARDLPIDVVAVNDLAEADDLARLLSRDSVHGSFDDVGVERGALVVRGRRIAVLHEPDPKLLPWGDLGVEVVVEASGHFTSAGKAAAHLDAGANRVVVSAPSKGADTTIVIGVNDDSFDPQRHRIISNASCTTNCLAPMVKILDDAFGIETGLMTTTHAYTGDQRLVDGLHGDPRRARAAALNIVPTTTGAARATSLVMASMDGRLDGVALRVPVADGSITDLVALLAEPARVDAVNDAFLHAAEDALAGIVEYSTEPLVSADIVGRRASCVFDSGLTMTSGRMVKVFGWYDNEVGYANRLAELTLIAAGQHRAAAQ
jgi:glyceraldehyde 3-phosphate dehydrogenase